MENEKPPYPEEPIKGKANSFTDRIVPEEPSKLEESVAIDTKQLCADLVKAGFQTAHLINPKIREATEKEVRNIGEPFANVVDKYDLTKYMKYFNYTQEVLLVYNVFGAVAIRIKEVKEDKRVDVE
ncbi:MAG: hypothetical protein KKF54_08110 [Candidatus Omnitrophica bacterium]|nr:hypothetical protein [Candidatus Omnitrophota bacterium]